MSTRLFLTVAGLLMATQLSAADPATIEKGRSEEKRACTSCHGLRIIHVQRLSRAAWDRELTKMTGWGTDIRDRAALMEYLVAEFGDDKPSAPLERSENAAGRK